MTVLYIFICNMTLLASFQFDGCDRHSVWIAVQWILFKEIIQLNWNWKLLNYVQFSNFYSGLSDEHHYKDHYSVKCTIRW